MSENPYEEGMASYMERLREIGREAASDGFECVVMMSYEDPMLSPDKLRTSATDYGCFGTTYGSFGLLTVIQKRASAFLSENSETEE